MSRALSFVTVLIAGSLLSGGPQSLLNPDDAEFQRRAPDVSHVRLDTTRGAIVLEMRRAWSPHGADRFYNLARAGFYDDVAIFRIRAGVWAQFGINGNPAIAYSTDTSKDLLFVRATVPGGTAWAAP